MLAEHINQDKILDYFDGKRMWMTLLRMTQLERNGLEDQELYNTRIVLCILMHTVRPGVEFSCRKFITVNALSFCFVATSFHSEELRSFAYAVLARFQQKLKVDLNTENFVEAPLYLFIIRFFKNSLESCNQRVCHVVSHFFARICKLVMVPEDPAFAPLMSFFSLKPTLQMNSVPEFFKLFFSSSTEHFRHERQWTLRLCTEAMLEPQDYQIMCPSYVVECALALFICPIADLWSKKLVLTLLKNCVEHESVSRDLFERLNLAAWIVQAIEYSRTTEWEERELVQIFMKMVQFVRSPHEDPELGSMDDRCKRRKMAKLAKSERKSPLMLLVVKTNAQRILDRVNKWDEGEETKRCRKALRRMTKEGSHLKTDASDGKK